MTAYSTTSSSATSFAATSRSATSRSAARIAGCLVLFLVAGLYAAPPAEAENYYLGLLGGVGGAVDGDPFDHSAFEAQFGYKRDLRDLVMIRFGQLDLSADDDLFAVDGELTWLTLSSEYRLPEEFYLSGVFVGLGYYQRRNDFGLGDDEGIGVTFGIDGEFAITDRFGFLVQLTGHWADIDGEQFWTTALGGVTFSF